MAAEVAAGRILNVRPSPAREDDHTPAAAVAEEHLREVDPPERVDLRAPWYAVGDQGRTGSCVGWALADSVLWRQLVRKGRLAEKDRLSPRFVWMAAKEMRAKQTAVRGEEDWRPTTFLEQGMTDVKSALDVARLYGAALEKDLRWKGALYPGGIDHFYASAAQRRVSRYFRLDPEEDAPVTWFAHWRRWIAQQGPVLIVVGVDRHFAAGARAAGRVRHRLGHVQPRRRARRLRAGRLPRPLQLGRGLGRRRLRGRDGGVPRAGERGDVWGGGVGGSGSAGGFVAS